MRNLLKAIMNLLVGVILGLIFVEVVLRVNTELLLRGMALPAPIEPPVTRMEYDVRYSDGDSFLWRPDLVRPLKPGEDRLESHAEFQTDEFGFRNDPPLPAKVDVVVLGRSYSLGAQYTDPWPKLLSKQTGLQVLNLSEPGSGLAVKEEYLQRFGMPRRPGWVLLDVDPMQDIIGSGKPETLMLKRIFQPFVQSVWRQFNDSQDVGAGSNPIFPVIVDLPGRKVNLTCCLHYMSFFSLDYAALQASLDWRMFNDRLAQMVEYTHTQAACMAVVYLPEKANIYFPLALYPEQLAPIVRSDFKPFRLTEDGRLMPDDASGELTVDQVRMNIFAGRDLIADFARQHGLLMIDPTEALTQAILNGNDPYMRYDSHFNSLGHEIIAEVIARALQSADCSVQLISAP